MILAEQKSLEKFHGQSEWLEHESHWIGANRTFLHYRVLRQLNRFYNYCGSVFSQIIGDVFCLIPQTFRFNKASCYEITLNIIICIIVSLTFLLC